LNKIKELTHEKVKYLFSELQYGILKLLREYKHNEAFFDVLLIAHLSIFISVINQLNVKNFVLNTFISCLYMFRAHVLETGRGMK